MHLDEGGLESGFAHSRSSPTRQRRRAVLRFLFGGIRGVFQIALACVKICVVVLCLYALAHIAVRWRMRVIGHQMAAMASAQLLCQSPAHASFESHNVISLFNEARNQSEVFYDTRVISGSKETKRTTEMSLLCSAHTAPAEWTRHATIYVDFRTDPFHFTRQKRVFTGGDSLCIQHMLDAINGINQCGALKGGNDDGRRHTEL